jgi:hypothetical protein
VQVTSTEMIQDKYIGLGLAISSSLAIGDFLPVFITNYPQGQVL